jgi:hypothetical protein
VLWCEGASLVTLSVIYLQFKHSAAIHHPIWFALSRTIICLYTSWLCKGYFTKESYGVLHQMTCPPPSPDLNPIEMVWDELDRSVKDKQPASAQHMWHVLLQDCWESISYEAGCQECAKLSIRQRVSTLKNLIYIY